MEARAKAKPRSPDETFQQEGGVVDPGIQGTWREDRTSICQNLPANFKQKPLNFPMHVATETLKPFTRIANASGPGALGPTSVVLSLPEALQRGR